MPSVVLIAGSPSESSRSQALLEQVAHRLDPRQVFVDRISIRDISPQALLLGDFGHPSITHATQQVLKADAVVVATPVYKAAYSGVLKVFLDILPQDALKQKVVLPLATGGSPHHMLALDYALRPVLQSLGAKHILPGVYATEAQLPRSMNPADPSGSTTGFDVHPDITERLNAATQLLLSEGLKRPLTPVFQPVAFHQVRCSV